MYSDLTQATTILNNGHFTCVLRRGEEVITDTRRGIRPLMELLDSGRDLRRFSAADKVVGKAAAMIYCLLQISALHAGVLSRPALQILQRHGIRVTWDTLVDAIRNRTGTGFCPMESAVMELDDPSMAPDAIRRALAALDSK